MSKKIEYKSNNTKRGPSIIDKALRFIVLDLFFIAILLGIYHFTKGVPLYTLLIFLRAFVNSVIIFLLVYINIRLIWRKSSHNNKVIVITIVITMAIAPIISTLETVNK